MGRLRGGQTVQRRARFWPRHRPLENRNLPAHLAPNSPPHSCLWFDRHHRGPHSDSQRQRRPGREFTQGPGMGSRRTPLLEAARSGPRQSQPAHPRRPRNPPRSLGFWIASVAITALRKIRPCGEGDQTAIRCWVTCCQQQENAQLEIDTSQHIVAIIRLLRQMPQGVRHGINGQAKKRSTNTNTAFSARARFMMLSSQKTKTRKTA